MQILKAILTFLFLFFAGLALLATGLYLGLFVYELIFSGVVTRIGNIFFFQASFELALVTGTAALIFRALRYEISRRQNSNY